MARAPTVIKVPGGGGLDQFTDPRHVEPVNLLSGENLRIPKAGSYGKRLGMGGVTDAQSGITGDARLYALGDQVLVGDGVNLRSYTPSSSGAGVTQRMPSVGALPQALVDSNGIWTGKTPTVGNIAYGDSCYCVAWVSESNLFVEVYDLTTGAPYGYAAAANLKTGVYRAQVCFLSNAFYVGVSYTGSANIDMVKVPITGGVAATTTYAISVALHNTSAEFRLLATSAAIVLIQQNGVGFVPMCSTHSSAGALLSGPTAIVEGLGARKTGMHASADVSDNVFVSYCASSGGANYVRYCVFNASTSASVLAATTVVTDAADSFFSTAIYRDSATASVVAFQRSDATAGRTCEFATASSAGAVVALTGATIAWCGPVSGFFKRASGQFDIWLSCGGAFSGTPTTYIPYVPTAFYTSALMRLSTAGAGSLQAMPNGITGPRTSTFNVEGVADVVSPSAGVYTTVTRLFLGGLNKYALEITSSSFADTKRWRGAAIGRHLLLSGGTPTYYDGAILRETGFVYDIQGPQTLTVANTGTLIAGTYRWVFVYCRTDRTGQVIRGVPSTPIEKTVIANDRVTFTLPYLSVTADPYNGGTVIEIYRTEASGSIYYLLDTIQNAPFSIVGTYADTGAVIDAVLATRPQLYTTGGAVPNVMPPPSVGVFGHKSRAFYLEKDRIWFSKLFVDGDFPQFADEFTIDVIGGNITGGVSLDDFAVIFERSRIWILTGEGPNDAGLQLDYQLRQCAADLGCTEPSSLLVHSGGVFFRSGSGLYNLNRGLQVEYLGRFVEDELSSATTISAAVIHPTQHVALFSLTGGTAGRRLVYDYLHQVWLKDVCQADQYGLAVVGSSLYAVTSGAALLKEGTDYLDNGTWITMLAKFGFMESPGTEYQMARVFEATFSRVTSHGISIAIYNGYKASAETTSAWTAAQIDALADLPVYTIDAANTYPLSDAATVQISDVAPSSLTGNNGQGAVLTGIAIDLEPQTGTVRKAAANRR